MPEDGDGFVQLLSIGKARQDILFLYCPDTCGVLFVATPVSEAGDGLLTLRVGEGMRNLKTNSINVQGITILKYPRHSY